MEDSQNKEELKLFEAMLIGQLRKINTNLESLIGSIDGLKLKVGELKLQIQRGNLSKKLTPEGMKEMKEMKGYIDD